VTCMDEDQVTQPPPWVKQQPMLHTAHATLDHLVGTGYPVTSGMALAGSAGQSTLAWNMMRSGVEHSRSRSACCGLRLCH
jgi:hypothetical protein